MRKGPPPLLILMLSLILAISSAAASFAVAAPDGAGVNLDQWANTDGAWQNGDLNKNNSVYAEGEVVPFRLAIEGLTPGVHTIHLNWDVTASGHAAYDFLASYDATESPDLCAAGGGGVSSLCPSLPTAFPLAMFTDTFSIDGKPIAGAYGSTPRVMTLYGVSAASFGPPTYTDGAHSSGDVELTFTASGTAVLLAWGGHIAATSYWGPDVPQGAGMVSGAPWHMRTQSLDGGGQSNQDRSIQTSALPDPVIRIVKYQDTNGDGDRDAGEPGLAGWSFTIYDSAQHDEGTYSTGTDGTDGTVTVTMRDADTYTVVEDLQTGWTNTDPGTGSETAVAPRGTTTELVFGNRFTEVPENGTVQVYKYNDENGDGDDEDGADPAIAGWDFTVQAVVEGTPTGPTYDLITGSDGYTDVLELAPGTYGVCETLGEGWTNTYPGSQDATVCWETLVEPDQDAILTFGNHYTAPPENGTLRVFKYDDIDNDGSRAEGEPGLSGWRFTVEPMVEISTLESLILTTGSSPLGRGTLSLPEGWYEVCEQSPLPTGWSNTDPGDGLCNSVYVPEGQDSDVLYFGNHYTPTPTPTPQDGTLQVTKYNDTDRNGTRGTSEPGLAGWAFRVYSGTTLLTTLTTDANGVAAIGLVAGTYTVTEVTQTGWTNTEPGGTTPTKTATVVAGQVTGVIFGNAVVIIPPTTQTQLVITKYADGNRNGARDTGEGVLAGFTFTIRDSAGTVVRTVVSGADGTATVTGLALGAYSITEEATTGWVNTDPGAAAGARKFVTFTSTATSATVIFGNAQVQLPSTSTSEDGMVLLLLALLAGVGLALPFAARRGPRMA